MSLWMRRFWRGYSSDTAALGNKRIQKNRRQPFGIEGTVPLYSRHLVLLDAKHQPTEWAKKLEESDHIVSTYDKAIASIKDPKTSLKAIVATVYDSSRTKIFSSANQREDDSALHDLLIFPDGVRIDNISKTKVQSLVQGFASEKSIPCVVSSLGLQSRQLPQGLHILVCAHAERDFRCGCNGPNLLRWLQESAEHQHKDASVYLYATSHFGGHRYAANCIVYPRGDWFGLLNTKTEADNLLAVMKLQESQPQIELRENWRGRVGLSKEKQIDMVMNKAS